jgi:ribose transport system permease protein
MKRSFEGFIKSQNFILLVIITLGVSVLGVSSQGNFFGEISVTTFFTFLAVPIMIGLAQMITIAVGQLNLAI